MKENLTLVPVVAVALVDESGAILLQQRRLGSAHGGMWEFPGGKVEPQETAEMALIREVREELGIVLDAANLVPATFASDPSQPPARREPYVILLYTCHFWTGEPRCLAGEAIAWHSRAALARLGRQGGSMPPLDIALAEALLRTI